ncbi:gliding motility lipoprotein GldH [Kaistella palustris]
MPKFIACCSVILLLFSCNKNAEKVVMNELNGKWGKKEIQNFRFEVTDFQNLKNIIFVVRNNNEYPYSNIRLIVDLRNDQTKQKEVDTLNYILAKPNGEWIGQGFGETKETLFQYKLNYKFPRNGSYTLGMIQAMRADTLPGIEDIGVKIETAKP